MTKEKIYEQIRKYQHMSYEQLLNQMGLDNHYELREADRLYQLEINIFWDDKPDEALRVAAFTDYFKSKWWQLGDRPIYSSIVQKDGKREEWIDPALSTDA